MEIWEIISTSQRNFPTKKETFLCTICLTNIIFIKNLKLIESIYKIVYKDFCDWLYIHLMIIIEEDSETVEN